MRGDLVRVVVTLLVVCATAAAPAEKQVFSGDLHLHTSLSFDAWATNTRAVPEDAYRFARGEAIPYKGGKTIQLEAPLDFLAVTDHAEYLDVLPRTANPDSPVGNTVDESQATYEAKREGTPLPEEIPGSIQEQAWRSASWYTPAVKE